MPIAPLLTASALIAAGMMTGRLLGFLREIMLAGTFGASGEADAAILLLLLPDLVTGALIGGAAGAVLIPAFAARAGREALALFWQALAAAAAGFLAIALAAFLLWPGASLALALTLFSLPLAAATAIAAAWLQHRGRLIAPAFATALFNGVILLGLWLAPATLTALAAGIALAALLRLCAHLAAFIRDGGTWPESWRPAWPRAPLARAYATAAAGGMVGMLPQYIPYLVLAAGSGLAVFNYAFKLALLPGAIAQTVAQMALLPWLTQLKQNGDTEAERRAHGFLLQSALLVSLLLCAGLSLIGQPLAALCFGHGRMTAEDAAAVGRLFSLGIWAFPGMWLTAAWQQIYYAQGNARLPFLSSLAQAGLMAALAWLARGDGAAMMLAYVIAQTAPLLLLACAAPKHGIVLTQLPSYALLKPVLDRAVAFFALTALLPLLALLGLLIRCTSRGSAIYGQTRVGKDGQPFRLYKFRSMVEGADRHGYQTQAGDSRITPVGHFLRKTSLDELPQLFNVLKGEMSLIGPRPDTPMQEADYAAADWRLRHSVRPGITGLAQVSGRSQLGAEARLAYDLEYARNASCRLDLSILLKTCRALLGKDAN